MADGVVVGPSPLGDKFIKNSEILPRHGFGNEAFLLVLFCAKEGRRFLVLGDGGWHSADGAWRKTDGS